MAGKPGELDQLWSVAGGRNGGITIHSGYASEQVAFGKTLQATGVGNAVPERAGVACVQDVQVSLQQLPLQPPLHECPEPE